MNIAVLTFIILTFVCLPLFIIAVYALYKFDNKPRRLFDLFRLHKLIWVSHPAGSRYSGSLEEELFCNDYDKYYRYLRNYYTEYDMKDFVDNGRLHKIDKNKYSLDICGDTFIYEVIR